MPFGFLNSPSFLSFSHSHILSLFSPIRSVSLSHLLFFARILNLSCILLSLLRIILKQKKKLQNIYGVCDVDIYIYICNIYISMYII